MEAPRCARCNERVYMAERYNALGKVWHKSCFRCTSCSKKLELGKHLENNKMPYCETCYAKLFGPRGYGFGVGAGILAGNFDGTTPTQAPATSANWRKLRMALKVTQHDHSVEEEETNDLDYDGELVLEDKGSEQDQPDVLANVVAAFGNAPASSKRLSKRSSTRSSARMSSRSHRLSSRPSVASNFMFDEPEEEPMELVDDTSFVEKRNSSKRRSSRRRSNRRHSMRNSEEPKSFWDQLKEFCGCGRNTVEE